MCNFGHLHTHSEYSTLDGMGKIKELLTTAKSFGQDFIAITDHGTMSGLYEAQKVGDELEIKVIHGCEFYYERETDGKNGHLLVLAKDNNGLRNLFEMQRLAQDNVYRKPRINWDILKDHHEGLIVTSACLGSSFNQYLMQGDILGATEWARKFKDVFGSDFYIELQPNKIPEQHLVNQAGLRIARQLDISIVATNDVHYTFESDCFPHEVLLAMQMNNKMSDEKRFKFSTEDFWLKSEEEMYETFEGLSQEVVQEALHTTREIADKCSARIEKGHYLPSYYNIPEGKTERQLLVEEIKVGARKRKLATNQEFMKDVQHEINVIDRNGYSGYFLIVQDYVTSAKKRGELVGDGRGSGAGSKVAYTTGITEIPPHEFDLLFERFLADGRSPDFDVDFSDQQAVFNDLQRKYGEQNVARIVAFGRMTPRSVIRKVMSAFEHPMHIIGTITKLVPELCPSLEQAYKDNPELLEYKKKYKTEWDVIERLENVISHETMHAGGVVIYPGLTTMIPVKKNNKSNGMYVATWDKKMVEDMGFFKFDVLGLETLPIVYNTLNSIERATGKKINLAQINREDQRVYDMLCEGDVSGIFQIAGQSSKVIQQQPRNFRDLIAINALIRPGVGDWQEYIARREGKQWEVHPIRMPYLKETEGLIAYQEQYLLDAKHLAGWDVAFSDKNIRKNKNIKEDKPLAEKFLKDCVERGINQDDAISIWEEICIIVGGGYGFNKSHSASYAMLTYQTAWLKCHYPEHFYASLMSGEKTDGDGQDAIAGYIAECKKRGIKILPPDINSSGDHFIVGRGGIHYRLTTIKHVGESAIKHIYDLRPIASFDDFMQRRNKSEAKKNVVINLIKAGAFDFDNPRREDLLWRYDMSERTKTQIKQNFQTPLYDVDDLTYMEWEKEVLGMYLSQHPMERYGFKSLDEYEEGSYCIQGGEVVSIYDFHPQKNPAKPKMAFITLNTLYGNVKATCFATKRDRTPMWGDQEVQKAFTIGNLVLIRGRKQGKDVLVDSVEILQTKSN